MRLYNNQEVTIAFTIDYSANRDRMTVYEIQKLGSNHFDTTNRELLERREEQQKLWFEHFHECNAGNFLIDLPSILDGSKFEQRKLLTSNPNTASLCPNHLLCNEAVSITDILSFIDRHNNKVVLKTKGSCGKGNVFLRDIMPGITTQEMVEDFRRKNGDFVIEEEVMHAPDANATSVGVYYRAIVFYNSEQGTVNFFDVYKITLDTDLSTNSHSDHASIVLNEELYLLTNNVASLRCKMAIDKQCNPELHKIKKNAFLNVGELLADYIFCNSSKLISTKAEKSLIWFVKNFHANTNADNINAYNDFFRNIPQIAAKPPQLSQNQSLFSKAIDTANQNNFCDFSPGFLIDKRF